MTSEAIKIDCQVICDLMIVYASGEASPETVAYIEAHLEDCPECRDAYEAAQRGEDLLAELEPVVRPINIDGRVILVRIQRVVFAALSALLFLTVLALALAERWIVRDLLGLSLSQLYVIPGGWEWIALAATLAVLYGGLHLWRTRSSDETDRPYIALIGTALAAGLGISAYSYIVRAEVLGVLTAGTLLFVLYIFMLRYRARGASGRFTGEFLLSLEATVPLLFLVLAALTVTSSGSFPAAAIAIGLVIFALVFTLVQLSELPYMTVLTLAALVVGGLMLIGNAVGGFVRIFDLSLDWPTDLGHPSGQLAGAPAFDLGGLGYAEAGSTPVTAVDREILPEGAAGFATEYSRLGAGEVTVYTLQFPDQDTADEFFTAWVRGVDDGFYAVRLDLSTAGFREPDGRGEHPLNWWLELPGVWFGQEGQLLRAYRDSTLTAYNAWQIDEWVTIVTVEGIPTRALPLARAVKEVVAEAYGP